MIGLVFGAVWCDFDAVMKRWSIRQLVTLFLTVFVTVGMSLSVVQASNMTLKMAIASDMGAAGHSDCNGCPTGSGDAGQKGMGCVAVCIAPVLAMLKQSGPAILDRKAAPLLMPRYAQLDGTTSAPEPYPPRPTNIG